MAHGISRNSKSIHWEWSKREEVVLEVKINTQLANRRNFPLL